jgi:hypothetical protein
MKKITLTIVVEDKDIDLYVGEIQKCPVSQLGVCTLAYGTVEKLTGDEEEYVKNMLN